MGRDNERQLRALETPIVHGLPDVPGIGAAMRLTADLGFHLRGLADQLLVEPFPGATLRRAEREMLATSVSAANNCFFCMDSHAAHATALLERDGNEDAIHLLDALKDGSTDEFDPKMSALLRIARLVAGDARRLRADDIERACAAGASDGDVQLAVLIASGFAMYNRMVDGLRARTPASVEAYEARAAEIAEHGYSAPARPRPAPESNGAD
jgi:uncharacterized peroxidase-related enzyme